ncbi:hypothetical protein LI328DRAFT_130231 [Trichoderma asperelloides]|nr:hypothetical protein LI328DRAFT_130231 [Trichoderma asperelloides]
MDVVGWSCRVSQRCMLQERSERDVRAYRCDACRMLHAAYACCTLQDAVTPSDNNEMPQVSIHV